MIIDDLLSSLKDDAPVQEVRICVFWTAVVSRRCGLASTQREEPHAHSPVLGSGTLTDKSALELATFIRSNNPLEATVGMAAINSVLEIDEARCVEANASQVLLERGEDKKVAVVGHFPFIDELRGAAETLWVLEQRPAEGDLPAEMAAEILPQADVAAITGVTFLNHTFEPLLRLCRPDAFVLVLGPSAPLWPALFDYGVDAMSGTKVVDTENVLRYISQGASFRQVKRGKGVKLLTMFA
jgi:uncharacterized protein (DUF4213/DUF364 family)